MILLITSNRRKSSYEIKRFREESRKKANELTVITAEEWQSLRRTSVLKSFKDETFTFQGKKVKSILLYMGGSTIYQELLDDLQSLRNQINCVINFDCFNLAHDKWITYKTAKENDIPTPKTIYINDDLDIAQKKNLTLDTFDLPVIIKGISGARGEQVFLAQSNLEVESILKKTINLKIIAQEYISSSVGRDIRVYVVKGEPQAAILRSSSHTFRANVAQGGKATPIKMSPELYELAHKVGTTFSIDFGGIDFLFGQTKNTYLLTEINIAAAFESVESSTGVNITEKILATVS